MRDVLGVVFLVLFVLSAVALVVGLLNPGRLSRRRAIDGLPAPGPGRGKVALATVPMTAGFLLLVLGVWLLPNYSVKLVPPRQVVAAPGSHYAAVVANSGRLAGTRAIPFSVDGTAQTPVAVKVGGHATANAELPLPDSLTPGTHTLKMGDATIRFTALTPPDYREGKLKLSAPVVKVGDSISLQILVANRGEADGTYPGEFTVNGKQEDVQPTTVAGNDSAQLVFTVSRTKPGRYRLAVGGAKAGVMVVKTTRPASGKVLRNTMGGGGNLLVVTNKYPDDLMVYLTSSPKTFRHPVLVMFVRGHKAASVASLHDGSYYVYWAIGGDWNSYTKGFLTIGQQARFVKPIAFNTSSWTTAYNDYASWTRWITTHVQSTKWTLTFGASGINESASVPIGPAVFPTLD